MKTTIFELLRMIKDGKAPQKIVFNNDEYEYNKKGYLNTYSGDWLFDVYDITDILNDEVIILETTITYKKDNIEKLKTHKEIDEPDYYANYLEVYDGGECEIDEATSFIVDKINEIIDHLNNQ